MCLRQGSHYRTLLSYVVHSWASFHSPSSPFLTSHHPGHLAMDQKAALGTRGQHREGLHKPQARTLEGQELPSMHVYRDGLLREIWRPRCSMARTPNSSVPPPPNHVIGPLGGGRIHHKKILQGVHGSSTFLKRRGPTMGICARCVRAFISRASTAR